MAVTKMELAKQLMDQLGFNQKESKDFVEAFFEELKTCLANGKDVKLSGFGNFDLRKKSERPGRNPRTGVEVPIKPRKVVSFKAGLKLKNRVKELTKT